MTVVKTTDCTHKAIVKATSQTKHNRTLQNGMYTLEILQLVARDDTAGTTT